MTGRSYTTEPTNAHKKRFCSLARKHRILRLLMSVLPYCTASLTTKDTWFCSHQTCRTKPSSKGLSLNKLTASASVSAVLVIIDNLPKHICNQCGFICVKLILLTVFNVVILIPKFNISLTSIIRYWLSCITKGMCNFTVLWQLPTFEFKQFTQKDKMRCCMGKKSKITPKKREQNF